MRANDAIRYLKAMARAGEVVEGHYRYIATCWHAPKAAKVVECVLTLRGSVYDVATDRVRKPGKRYGFRTCYYITFDVYCDLPTE